MKKDQESPHLQAKCIFLYTNLRQDAIIAFQSRDHLILHNAVSYLIGGLLESSLYFQPFPRYSVPAHVNEHTNEHTNEQTNKHDGSQYLLAELIILPQHCCG